MNSKFSLIEKLNSKQVEKPKRNPFPPGIEYQEYILEIKGVEQTVFIPLKECDEFEKSLTHKSSLDDDDLRDLLRQHRGIRKS